MPTHAPSKLRQWRRERGFSQTQAVQAVGVVRRTWNIWENGNGKPDDIFMIRLYVLTDGWITPNDFYDLPMLPRMKAAA